MALGRMLPSSQCTCGPRRPCSVLRCARPRQLATTRSPTPSCSLVFGETGHFRPQPAACRSGTAVPLLLGMR